MTNSVETNFFWFLARIYFSQMKVILEVKIIIYGLSSTWSLRLAQWLRERKKLLLFQAMEIIWCNYYFSQSKYIRHWSNFILLQTWRHVRIIFLWLNIDAYAISIKKTWGSVYYRWYVLGTLHVNHLLLFQTRLKFIIRYLCVCLLIWFCATSLVFWCKTKISKWESESWQKKSITK
jgi:hypothetical protein